MKRLSSKKLDPQQMHRIDRSFMVKGIYSMGSQSPFFQYLAEKHLAASHCPDCDQVIFPPKAYCPKCLTLTEWVEIEGKGELFAVISLIDAHIEPNHDQRFEVFVSLTECQAIIRTTIAQVMPEDLVIGLPVVAVFADQPLGVFDDLYFVPAQPTAQRRYRGEKIIEEVAATIPEVGDESKPGSADQAEEEAFETAPVTGETREHAEEAEKDIHPQIADEQMEMQDTIEEQQDESEQSEVVATPEQPAQQEDLYKPEEEYTAQAYEYEPGEPVDGTELIKVEKTSSEEPFSEEEQLEPVTDQDQKEREIPDKDADKDDDILLEELDEGMVAEITDIKFDFEEDAEDYDDYEESLSAGELQLDEVEILFEDDSSDEEFDLDDEPESKKAKEPKKNKKNKHRQDKEED